MSAAEIESIIVEAQSCAEGECAIDEVESLIANLQGQQSLLSKRIEEISGLIKELEHVNGKDERPVDEVRETVRAIFRIFSLGVSVCVCVVLFIVDDVTFRLERDRSAFCCCLIMHAKTRLYSCPRFTFVLHVFVSSMVNG
jgi:hypothetical protein